MHRSRDTTHQPFFVGSFVCTVKDLVEFAHCGGPWVSVVTLLLSHECNAHCFCKYHVFSFCHQMFINIPFSVRTTIVGPGVGSMAALGQ